MKNKINSLSLMFVMLIALIGVILPMSTYAYDSFSGIGVNLVNQNPDPVYAGDIVDAKIGINNVGYGAINNVVVEVNNQYPFTVVSNNNKLNFASILSGTDYAQVASFKLKINNNATAGTYPLDVKIYDSSNPTNYVTKQVTISVGTSQEIEVLNISKTSINPGGTENVTFLLKNVGSSNLNNLQFSWSNPTNNILPVGSDNTLFINSLKAGESKNITFAMSASSSATPGLYQLALTMKYQNTNGSGNIQQTTETGMNIGGGTNFDIFYSGESGGEYTFTVANTGANDVSSVVVKLDNQSEWQSSTPSQIVGNLNAGDYTTLSYSFLKKTGKLIFDIEYTDTTGKRIVDKQAVNMVSTSDLNSTTTKLNSGTGTTYTRNSPLSGLQGGITTLTTWFKYLLYVLVIAIVGFVGYKYYKKKKSKQLLMKKKN